jgi:hypothetical protein
MMGLLCRQPRACAFAAKAALFVAQRSGRSQRSAGAIQRLGKESRSTGPQAVVPGPHAEEDAKRPSRSMAASSVAAPSFEPLASLALRMRAEIKSTCAARMLHAQSVAARGLACRHRACPFASPSRLFSAYRASPTCARGKRSADRRIQMPLARPRVLRSTRSPLGAPLVAISVPGAAFPSPALAPEIVQRAPRRAAVVPPERGPGASRVPCVRGTARGRHTRPAARAAGHRRGLAGEN